MRNPCWGIADNCSISLSLLLGQKLLHIVSNGNEQPIPYWLLLPPVIKVQIKEGLELLRATIGQDRGHDHRAEPLLRALQRQTLLITTPLTMVVALAKANDDDTTLPHVAVDASVVIATLVLCHEVVTGPDQPLVAAAETPDNVLLCPHLVGGAVSHKDVAPFTLWERIPATFIPGESEIQPFLACGAVHAGGEIEQAVCRVTALTSSLPCITALIPSFPFCGLPLGGILKGWGELAHAGL